MIKETKPRSHPRVAADFSIAVRWMDDSGLYRQMAARGMNLSKSGARVLAHEAIPQGTPVIIDAPLYNVNGGGTIRYCTPKGGHFSVGIQFGADASWAVHVPPPRLPDYYEVLQISPNADEVTIGRVYRMMAARYHPDNKESGDADRFRLLKQAYEVLSDFDKRADYDAQLARHSGRPLPVFELKDFVDDTTGEVNRRLGLLCLLYNQRRHRPTSPGLSVLQLESMMGFPREYLDFTVWYLKEKRLVVTGDNSDYIVTAAGVDYIEVNVPATHVAARLLSPYAVPQAGAGGVPETVVPSRPLLA
jgi:hypothetical protein